MRKGRILVFAGSVLIAAGLMLTLWNILDSVRASDCAAQAAAELTALLVQEDGKVPSAGEEEIPDHILDPTRKMPTEEIDGALYIGMLHIPALSLELPVMSAWSDEGLKNAPCRYSGTAYRDGFVICAHNYRSHFGSLGKIHMGDEVTFTDVDGNVFRYAASSVETLQPTDIEEMTDEQWAMTLFTCTLGGKTRMAVRCERIE